MMFAFMVIIGNISKYERVQHNENYQEIEKWRNADIIMSILLVYICVIVLFVKSIIVANMARLSILGEGSSYLEDSRKASRELGRLGAITPSVYSDLMIPIHDTIYL